MYRQANGSVVLWHTEEDVEYAPGSGFDQLRLAKFTINEGGSPVVLYAFIYPDLLPGPAFGWRSDGFAQAVDTLHIKFRPEQRGGILANSLTWLTLLLGPSWDPIEVVRQIGPYYDGYALNNVSLRDGKVCAGKLEFTADHILSSILDGAPGEYLFQVNIFSQDHHGWVKELEQIEPRWKDLFQQRIYRTEEYIQNRDHLSGKQEDMSFFFELLTSQAGGGWAYANPDVKAYIILRMSQQGMEIWLGDGPALKTDRYSVMHIPLDSN
jgi:hypothetical protein